MTNQTRRLSVGAEITREGVHFRVFAPDRKRVAVVLDGDQGRVAELERESDGHFGAFVPGVAAGARYRLRLDDDVVLVPDPASRFQPEGPHGASMVVDSRAFAWTDRGWPGITLKGQVIYELHVGTFTEAGTWAAAAEELGELARIGVTVIEMMPIHEFPGTFGWGYDGVDLYAPAHVYGTPDDLRAFVDRAHALGIGVILDVVYNHFGPDGNHLTKFSSRYFTKKYECDWGEAIDFESEPAVRAFFIDNAGYWIDEYHFDGLRLDATQSVQDASKRHVLAEIAASARAAAKERKIIIVSENEPQEPTLARPEERGGYGHDAMWNDDFHHAAFVAATGRREAYYSPTRGTAQELVSAIRWGFLFQGQYYPWQKQRRGGPALDLAPEQLVLYLDNHDQVANSVRGARLRHQTTPGVDRALTTALLLAPGTPMLFQGQEFGATTPFLYFADHEPDLARLVAEGRAKFLRQFPSAADPAVTLDPPHDRRTFDKCKLRFEERRTNHAIVELHRELLRLRREDPVFSAQTTDRMHGAVLADDAFLIRFATGTGEDRLVIVNLGRDLDLDTLAEPLLAPPGPDGWRVLFSTEDPRYGGTGTALAEPLGQRVIAGRSALVLAPGPKEEA